MVSLTLENNYSIFNNICRVLYGGSAPQHQTAHHEISYFSQFQYLHRITERKTEILSGERHLVSLNKNANLPSVLLSMCPSLAVIVFTLSILTALQITAGTCHNNLYSSPFQGVQGRDPFHFTFLLNKRVH